MATREQTTAALRRVAAANKPMQVDADACSVWYDILRIVPVDVLDTATQQVLETWTRTYPPGPGMIRNAAGSLMAAESARSRVGGIAVRGDISQAQQTAALKANIAAAISLDGKTREAGRTGAVYEQIRRQAAQAGYADLPAWKP